MLKWILVLQPGVSDLILSISNMSGKEFKSFSHCVYGIWLQSDDINKQVCYGSTNDLLYRTLVEKKIGDLYELETEKEK